MIGISKVIRKTSGSIIFSIYFNTTRNIFRNMDLQENKHNIHEDEQIIQKTVGNEEKQQD
jgi:hypothetical protein